MKPEVERMVEACKRHDERAYKQLYDIYAPMMLTVCMRYARDRDAAQDILQDGFVKVFRHIRMLKDPMQLEGWMRRLMMNTAINSLRRVRESISLDDIGEKEAPAALHYDRYDMERITQAIQSLPEQYRVVFNLYEIEGYSHAEIGERIGLKESSVRAVLTRAKQRLVRALGDRNEY